LPALLTEAQTARYLSVSHACLKKWRLRGVGPPFIRLEDRLIRYQLHQVQAWLEAEQRACCSLSAVGGGEAHP